MPDRDQGRRSFHRHWPSAAGFDFTARMHEVCDDAARRIPELRHIDVSRVATAFSQARTPALHGLQASLTPLRFESGEVEGFYRGHRYSVQRVYDRGVEVLYILTFYMPRFMNLDFREKLITVFHELWHISPAFNGDLRRHPGRFYAHSHSQSEYDARMEVLADRWLETNPPESLLGFLRLNFETLQREYGPVYGMKIPRPKLLPAG